MSNAKSIQKGDTSPTLQQFLALRRSHFEEVLPRSKGMTSDKLIKLAVLASNKQPALRQCDMGSIFMALLQCAELGLEPSGTLGSAYLVPYGKTCTLVIGYRGLIDLARRSGALKQIEAHVVHERDAFRLRYGIDPILEHEPYLEGDPGKPRLVYVIAQLADGARHAEVMTMAEVDAIRKRSKASGSGPWVTDYEEMAKKTVARRACKWLPMSADLAHGLAAEDGDEEGLTRAPEASDVLGPTVEAPKTQTSKVKAMLVAQAGRPAFIDVEPGETEAEAVARTQAEAAAAIDDEPPPPGDADAPPNLI